MPIKQAEDYDAQANAYRFGYVNAVQKGNFINAAHFVEMLNSTLTPENRIEDLPKFGMDTNGFNYRGKVIEEAQKYCFYYMPIVEQAISNERAKLYLSYQQMQQM
jgi:hypothetical protein